MPKDDFSRTNMNLLMTLIGESKCNKLREGSKSLLNRKITDEGFKKIREEVYEKLVWKDIGTIEAEALLHFRYNTDWNTIKTKLEGGKVKRRRRGIESIEPVLGFIEMGLVEKDEKQFKIKKEGIKRICGYFLMEEYDQRIDK